MLITQTQFALFISSSVVLNNLRHCQVQIGKIHEDWVRIVELVMPCMVESLINGGFIQETLPKIHHLEKIEKLP